MQTEYARKLDELKRWQREQGNHCTICWNDNVQTQCASCGWWGYVPPTATPKVAHTVDLSDRIRTPNQDTNQDG